MSVFALLRGEILDYARTYININLGQLTLSPSRGKVNIDNEIGNFSCTITNLGLMLVSNFKIHIYTNEYGQVRESSSIVESNWRNELELGPFAIGPNEILNLPELEYKAIKRTVDTKVGIFLYVEAFELSWHYHLRDSTLHSVEVNDNIGFTVLTRRK